MQFVDRILGDESGLGLGASVAAGPDDSLIVTRGYSREAGDPGAVLRYRRVGDEWVRSVLFAVDHDSDLMIGTSLASDGTRIAVACPSRNPAVHGQVVLLDLASDPPGVVSITALLDDLADHVQFGREVDIDGRWLVVGAQDFEWPGRAGHGSISIFDLKAGERSRPAARLTAPQGVSGWGRVVAVADDRMFACAPGSFEGPGVFIIYEYQAGEWQELQRVTPPPGSPAGDRFGFALSVEHDLMTVGAPDMPDGHGSVHTYSIKDGRFKLI
ncbi:MAG: hypothetical protein KDA21_07180, partial [Phycisphaerales bacterium]|nr:hypothetical protein [Phycisphaerales bacterium]